MELIIGNKNYSSWSLRAWFMLKAFDLPFTETRLALFEPDFYSSLANYSPAGKVPVLIDTDITVWDSLAICEYINETYLSHKGWPADVADRALARAISCEMHSGFFGLRHELPMNCRATRAVTPTDAALKDIARIDAIWTELLQKNSGNGPWLFGDISIADMMFAPVTLRFHTYNVEVSKQSRTYVETVLAHPAIQAWVAAAKLESETITEEEVGEPV
ncbi:glutathione S-transferase family protein [Neptunomonas qingdaonensis]|uniref:Glutathione S-transferase n=1 Tax=Neptunomonas qingdaonensis TaxID=1045558 RepID=A0A1I2S9Y8_9GAMM|nr:glutathione S-transferase family protein [Neptunomonas qingdaonensis]SFG46781.1 glutathione S-transferase [Neptunomonas qingdaonensis]